MKSIAIIPARGGSKRLPGKNILSVDGKPLIAYSILAATLSNLFDIVMVSTDSIEISNVAESYGASVPFFRSEINSNDYATTADVIDEVLNEYKNNNIEFDYFCCIYPTALFVTKEDLVSSSRLLYDDATASAVMSVSEYSSPIQRSLSIKNNMLEYNWPQHINSRSQDLEPTYYDAAQFYWQKVETFQLGKSLVPMNTKPYILKSIKTQDIDTIEDFKLAEYKYMFNK